MCLMVIVFTRVSKSSVWPLKLPTHQQDAILNVASFLFNLGFTPPKAEQSTQGIESQEKEQEKDQKLIRKLVGENSKIKGAY